MFNFIFPQMNYQAAAIKLNKNFTLLQLL